MKDGDRVNAGQPLIVLADVQAKAGVDSLEGERRGLLARRARLEAERLGSDLILFPPELMNATPASTTVVDVQTNIFNTRRAHFLARQRVLTQRVAQLEEQIKGLHAQEVGIAQQRSMLSEEIEAKEQLLKKGYVPKPEFLRLKRLDADAGGREGELIASASRVKQQIGEAEVELTALQAERAGQIATEIDKVNQDLSQLSERLHASRDVLRRSVISAPISGRIVNLKFRNEHAVVQRGEPLMEIVPEDDMLLIEARVSPIDIDIVHNGLEAQIHFAAYPSRRAPRLFGKVLSVSADRLLESGTQKPYFLVKISVDREMLATQAPWI